MFRMWCKLFDDRGHLIKDTVIKNADSDLNRTRKIFAAIHDACYEFDLAEPIWSIPMFQNSSATRKYASLKITLLKISNLLIWKLRLLRKIRNTLTFCAKNINFRPQYINFSAKNINLI